MVFVLEKMEVLMMVNTCTEKKEGMGKESNPKGITYVGLFLNDKMHGKGKYTIEDRYTYEGDFENDDI